MKKIFLMIVLMCVYSAALAEGWFSIGNDIKCREFCKNGRTVLVCANKYMMSTVVIGGYVSCNSKVSVENKGVNFFGISDESK